MDGVEKVAVSIIGGQIGPLQHFSTWMNAMAK